MLTLEKYSGFGSRYTCPVCRCAKKFTRYIDTETGQYIADHVGRCDRESACGYHYKPKEYLAGHDTSRTGHGWRSQRAQNVRTPDLIEPAYLTGTLTNYHRNGFVQFLFGLFNGESQGVWQAINDYMIGTTKDGKTIFWQIDRKRGIRTGKIISYHAATGKRRKNVNPNWVHSEMKKAGLLKSDFELEQCFFGEHLLSLHPDLPIAITEAEKSAVIGSICKGVFPDFVWLACGGKSMLTVERLLRLGKNRKIILYPDADGFERWQSLAFEARKRGLTVLLSDLIEKNATDEEKANGSDLADYLIRVQARQNDPAIRAAFRETIEERLAIMTVDGGLTHDNAELWLVKSGQYADALRVAGSEP